MKIRFTIGRKLAIGFGVLLIAVLWTSTETYTTLGENLEINKKITEVYSPSTAYLNDLFFLITNSKMLIKNWVFIEKLPDTQDKMKLRNIHATEYPELLEKLNSLSSGWDEQDLKTFRELTQSIDTLFEEHKVIMDQLNNFESYDNFVILLPATMKVEENGDLILLTDRILVRLSKLIASHSQIAEEANLQTKRSFARFQQLIVGMGILLAISIIVIFFVTSRALVRPIDKLKEVINQMGKGELPDQNLKLTSDEIGEMSKALLELISGLRRISDFATEIGKGNFISEFRPLSEKDALGNSLLLMRENLKRAAQDEDMRKKLDNQRSWATQGIAKFGDILRENNDNLEELSTVIISELVKYLEVNQGGLFILNEEGENTYLDLAAFYAYDRKKYKEKRIEVGVGLVGQAVKENETMYITDIPPGYIHISSGLGADTPRSLVIVPIKIDKDIYGAVELASFTEIEPYKIEFIEKIGESIASAISRVKINIKTSKLLTELQEKSNRLALQEEQMRQKIIEMATAQEIQIQQENVQRDKIKKDYETKMAQLLAKNEKQLQEVTSQRLKLESNYSAINTSLGLAEYDISGMMITANPRYLKLSDMTIENLKGHHHSDYMYPADINTLEYQSLWADLSKGKVVSADRHFLFAGNERWFYETLAPVKDDEGRYSKAIAIVFDITLLREKEREWQKKLDEAYNELDRYKKNK